MQHGIAINVPIYNLIHDLIHLSIKRTVTQPRMGTGHGIASFISMQVSVYRSKSTMFVETLLIFLSLIK